MPRRKTPSKPQSKNGKTKNGKPKNGKVELPKPALKKSWAPKRGSAKVWMEKLGYTPATLRCRTLADMTNSEIAAIEIQYGAKVLRPIQGRKAIRKPRPADPTFLDEPLEVVVD